MEHIRYGENRKPKSSLPSLSSAVLGIATLRFATRLLTINGARELISQTTDWLHEIGQYEGWLIVYEYPVDIQDIAGATYSREGPGLARKRIALLLLFLRMTRHC